MQKVPRKKLPRRTNCRQCGSKELLTLGPDQFCCDCSWDTCKEYVEAGLMNNLVVSYKEHFFNAKPKLLTLMPVFVDSQRSKLEQTA